MNRKERADILLVQQGFFDSREKAKRAIMAGLVFWDQERVDKPGMKINRDVSLIVKGSPFPYVSRGGLKLEKAIQVFALELANKRVLDIGASTGGFTDCALQHGAILVYALDVGYGQLDWKLRNDERVIVMERTNFRHVQQEAFIHGPPQMATIDVSFISLRLIFPVLFPMLEANSQVVALIKPQFEAKREQVGKRGIVRDPLIHQQVIENSIRLARSLGYHIKGLSFSPITGGEGNIEFLLMLEKKEQALDDNDQIGTSTHWLDSALRQRWMRVIEQTVKEAHSHF